LICICPYLFAFFSFILEKDFSFCISKEKKTEKYKNTFGRYYKRLQHSLKDNEIKERGREKSVRLK